MAQIYRDDLKRNWTLTGVRIFQDERDNNNMETSNSSITPGIIYMEQEKKYEEPICNRENNKKAIDVDRIKLYVYKEIEQAKEKEFQKRSRRIPKTQNIKNKRKTEETIRRFAEAKAMAILPRKEHSVYNEILRAINSNRDCRLLQQIKYIATNSKSELGVFRFKDFEQIIDKNVGNIKIGDVPLRCVSSLETKPNEMETELSISVLLRKF
ncbi:hypothetical protein APICC_06225 [Apis cerana cerana]|uniref:Uncharacterized protein n=1 Tax=Apis cerana cerana TaxID=94128 RepID=A0A2A3EHB2_APICC|nr:hypothetical protein APICC_06225 [Apis cerana cerana]